MEILFSSRLIQVIVTTETFALGVNMPARSVVLDSLVRRIDGPRSALRVRELSQMAGRAGRRGMDEKGFVYLRVNPWETSLAQVEHLISGKPEEVSSRFNLTYATVLNLYRNYGKDLLPFYQKTLHAFQANTLQQREAFSLIERKLQLLGNLGYIQPVNDASPASSRKLTPKGEFALQIYGYELLLSELFKAGILDRLNGVDLSILMLALVYEPRRGRPAVRLPHRFRSMEEEAQGILEKIHREERRLRITPMTKGPAFDLSAGMERWIGGADFDKVVELVDMAEGELIRYLRMTVQLLRALAAARIANPALRDKAGKLLPRINRAEVDAEAELRRSL